MDCYAEVAVPAAAPPAAKGSSLLKSVSAVIGDLDKPWTQLGDLELDPVTAREVDKHRTASLAHLRSLEKIQVLLQKAQEGRTSKAMPVPKPEEPAAKMGICGSTAQWAPSATRKFLKEFCRSDLLRPVPAVPRMAPPVVKAKPKLRTVAWRFLLHGMLKR
jgi:hypothetical protein